MATWNEFLTERPDLAEKIRTRFEQGRDHVIATLRSDGAPRVSGTEVAFLDGELQLGMIDGSRKLADIRRDARVAIHAATLAAVDAHDWPGDAKVSGRALEYVGRVDPAHPEAAQLRIDLTEAVYTRVDGGSGKLVIDSWHDRGKRTEDTPAS